MSMASRMLPVLAATIALGACDPTVGLDLSGLWIAQSYEFRSSGGETVDLVERDGASFSLTVTRDLAGNRQVTTRFGDGSGGSDAMFGVVSLEQSTFTFDDVVFRFQRSGDVLTLVTDDGTFDFGSGSEPATLTIRLTQL